jgi:hypothetical protein
MRNQDAEQRRVVPVNALDCREKMGIVTLCVQRQAKVEHDALPARFQFNATSPDLFASTMDADSHAIPQDFRELWIQIFRPLRFKFGAVEFTLERFIFIYLLSSVHSLLDFLGNFDVCAGIGAASDNSKFRSTSA